MSTLRVLTYNLLFGGVGRERLILDVVTAIGADVAVFTEVTASDAFEAIADAVGPYHAGRGDQRGREYPVIVSRWPIVKTALFGPPWAPRKWVEATIRPSGSAPMTIHGVHLVPQPLWPCELWRCWEVGFLLKHLEGRSQEALIVAGDFNALARGDRQRWDGAPAWVRAQWLLQGGATPRWALRRLSGAGLVDCYRACNPRDDGFTVPSWNPGARIDYVFASPDLRQALRASGPADSTRPANSRRPAPSRSLRVLLGRTPITSLDGQASDHLPVWADFAWPEPQGAPPFDV
jgi:endonuclease/exonuclease/phosphatase family metal-dependent hydrolase